MSLGGGKADYLELGDWNAVCYECGRKFKASQLLRHWQGYYVCKEHWEPRQPQDFVRSINDVQTPPWVQPMPADTFAMGGSNGFFIPGNGITTPDIYIPAPPASTSFSSITSGISIGLAGASYVVGDIITIGSATAIVTTIDGSGGVTGLAVDNPDGSGVTCSVQGGFDPNHINAHLTVSASRLVVTADSVVTGKNTRITGFASTGVNYGELVITTLGTVGVNIGLADSGLTFSDNPLVALGSDTHGWAYASGNGNSYHNNPPSGTAYGVSFTTGDVISVIYDTGAQTIEFWKNGSSQGTAFSSITSSLALAAALNASSIITLNLTSDSWVYTPPAGAVSWPTFSGVVATGGSGTGLVVECPTVATVNYATLDTAAKFLDIVVSAWALVAYSTNALFGSILSTSFQATGVDQRRYCEFEIVYAPGGFNIGLAKSDFPWGGDSKYIGVTSDSYGISPSLKWNNDSSAAYGVGMPATVIVGMLFDALNGTLSFTVNGNDQGTAFTGLSGSFCPAISLQSGTAISCNFGSTAWRYTPPIGYNGWTA